MATYTLLGNSSLNSYWQGTTQGFSDLQNVYATFKDGDCFLNVETKVLSTYQNGQWYEL